MERLEQKVLAGRHLMRMPRPRGIHIAAKHRKEPFRHISAAPAGGRVIGSDHPLFFRYLFQLTHVRHAFFSVRGAAGMSVLILNLDSDHRTAVLIHEACCLLTDLCKKFIHQCQIYRIVCASTQFPLFLFLHQPVRKTAVSALSVRPGADAQPYFQVGLLTAGQKIMQISPAGEIPLSLCLLMVDPEHIGGNNFHSTLLHIMQRRFPLCLRVTGKMKLSHNRQNRSAVICQIFAVVTVHFAPISKIHNSYCIFFLSPNTLIMVSKLLVSECLS